MPQSSIYYALGRLSVLGKDMLDQSRIDRLLQADGKDEALAVLADFGWPVAEGFEKAADEHMLQAVKLVKSITTDPEAVDCFLLRYDINNIKILIKSRCLNTEYGMLSECGTLDRDLLIHAVAEHSYGKLPAYLAGAMNKVEKLLSQKTDPLEIDLILDRVMYETVFAKYAKKVSPVKTYFTVRADILNLIACLRALHMKKPASFIERVLLPYGTQTKAEWLKMCEKPEKLPLSVNRYGSGVYRAAIAAQMDRKKLPALEKAADDYLMSIFRPYGRDTDRPERILCYLLSRERETGAVRLIMTGKVNGFDSETIRERLREVYA